MYVVAESWRNELHGFTSLHVVANVLMSVRTFGKIGMQVLFMNHKKKQLVPYILHFLLLCIREFHIKDVYQKRRVFR